MRVWVRDIASLLVLSTHVLCFVLIAYIHNQAYIFLFIRLFFFVFASISVYLCLCWFVGRRSHIRIPSLCIDIFFIFDIYICMCVCTCVLFTVSGVVRSVVWSFDGRIVSTYTYCSYLCMCLFSRSILSDNTATNFISIRIIATFSDVLGMNFDFIDVCVWIKSEFLIRIHFCHSNVSFNWLVLCLCVCRSLLDSPEHATMKRMSETRFHIVWIKIRQITMIHSNTRHTQAHTFKILHT